MDDVFKFRDRLVEDYAAFSRSFSRISAPDIAHRVEDEYARGRYWPEPLIQINPNYKRSGTVQELVTQGSLHPACAELFKTGKVEGKAADLHLYVHQLQAIAKAHLQQSYVVTTGTGSGKSLSFFIPVIDRILKAKQADPTPRTRAIVIYPMNALANSQLEELDKFLHGYPAGQEPFSVKRYTGQESSDERKAIADNPPDILLTNFMMLELILTRFEDIDRRVVDHCRGLEFLVLDELHTYRGRQGADVAMLVRRIRERMQAEQLVCIGTSATMSSSEREDDRNKAVADVASLLFGTPLTSLDVIGETLERVTNPSRDVSAVKPLLLATLKKSEHSWPSFDAFKDDPLAIWVELNLGIDLPTDQPPRRARPITLNEASSRLAADAGGCDLDVASEGLRRFLVAAHDMRTPQGRAPFAFKLHQFISGPGKVLATLEAQGQRHITLDAQRFAPGRQTEGTRLYPVHFCRDCGQEYHPVWRSGKGAPTFDPREIDDISGDDDEDARYGFLCPVRPDLAYNNWEDLPESWLDLTKAEPKVKASYKHAVPESVSVTPQGATGPGGAYWFIPGKYRFCLGCGVTHEAYGKDMNRLASLSGEGRSSATTMLTLSAVRQLFELGEPSTDQPDPRKLLGFTDSAEFSAAFSRWRVMVDATRKQMDMADQVVKSYTTTHQEKQNAQRRYGDAARQYAVLLKSGNTQNSDFYTYRYLASQGFLPGYNFPRLPLMAWIPARGGGPVKGKDDEGSMVSRPRFLALSEFGPRSLIYHQGRMYRVVRAKLNVGSADHVSGNTTLATVASRVCSQCGYAHMGGEDGSEPTENLCENCGALLTDHDWVRNLYRIETVETVPVERISINDEDRQRQGFELQTTYRFLPGPEGRTALQTSLVLDAIGDADSPLASLKYAPAAQIWRINRGWRRRKNKEQLGFYINPITGQWSRKDEPGGSEDAAEATEELLNKVPNQSIVPFVEDHRNVLILAPVKRLEAPAMATLQAALKRGIELVFQIEESELVAEPLPTQDDRKALLFYEAAEGGAGVLTRLATEPDALAQVAAQALELMHHHKPSGAWSVAGLPDLEIKRKDGSSICEAGCYQCLLSYFNQPDHEHINRRDTGALGLLVALANARVAPQAAEAPATPTQTNATAGDDKHAQWLLAVRAAGCPTASALGWV